MRNILGQNLEPSPKDQVGFICFLNIVGIVMLADRKFDPYEQLKLRLNPDGTFTRLADLPTTDPNPDPVPDVPTVSKDVTVNPDTKTWVRLYLPVDPPPQKPLPIIVFFHGGGFVNYNAHDSVSDKQGSDLAAQIPSVVVNIEYRRVPEARLPAMYEDATDTLLWIQRQALDPQGDPWVKDHADFSCCYLYGRGNGGNIAYHAVYRAMDMDLSPVKIAGLVVNQPMFGGVKRTKSELRLFADQLLPLPMMDLMWELTLPEGTNKDHRFANPMADERHKRKVPALPKCLVIGFGHDPLLDRQEEFVTMLLEGGVNVEACFDDVGFHGIDVVDTQRAEVVMEILKEFIPT